MDNLKRLYDELVEYRPLSFKLRTTAIQELFTESVGYAGEGSLEEQYLSKEDEYLEGVKKLKYIDLDEGEITGTTKEYIYGYQDLSFNEFISYLYWRTLIRQRKDVSVPGGFLALYLIEIVNFVEIATVSEGITILNFLESLSNNIDKNLRQITNARNEFLFLYGTLSEAKSIVDYSKYEYIYEDDRIANQNMSSLLNCLCQRHYSSFLKSKMYTENSELIEKFFPKWFYLLCNYFAQHQIDLLDLYRGDKTYARMRMIYIKKIFPQMIIEKSIELHDTPIIKVTNEVNIITKFYTDGTIRNKTHLYVRDVVIKYILRLYDCKMRKTLNYPKTRPSSAELKNGFYNLSISQLIIDIFESIEFNHYFCN